MNKRDVTFAMAAIRFGIFAVVSVVVTSVLVTIMGNFGNGTHVTYHAVFSSASELTSGDEVRVAGVIVGKVKDVDFHGRNQALVTFEVQEDIELTRQTRASIHFLNLIGDRYLSLSQGDEPGPPLEAGDTLPVERTTPALNLTELFNGFQPLFAALSPEDVNELSLNLVRVLQGESGTVEELLSNTASLTNSLADRDLLIGEVIDNLTELMTMVDDRHEELDVLIVSMRDWFGSLAEDREVIGESLEGISDVSEALADLLDETRPALQADIAELGRLFTILAEPENKEYLDRTLELLPPMLAQQTRIGVYGSWYNYYLCEFQGGVVLPSIVMDQLDEEVQKYISEFTMVSTAARCQ